MERLLTLSRKLFGARNVPARNLCERAVRGPLVKKYRLTQSDVQVVDLQFMCQAVQIIVALRNVRDDTPTVVHLPSKPRSRRMFASQLRSGTPAAPKSDCLPLLPSGPGGVRRLLLRRTQPSMPLGDHRLDTAAPRRGIQPRCSGLRVAPKGGRGTASSPSSTTLVSVWNLLRLSRWKFPTQASKET